MEMRCYSKKLHISYKDQVTNEEVRAGNRTTQRPPDDRKDTQTAVVWSGFPFIRSGQNHLARHSERGKKTRQTEKQVGKQHQRMDRPGVRQVLEGSGEQGKWRKLVAKSSVVPHRPSRLRDRWWWWWWWWWWLKESDLRKNKIIADCNLIKARKVDCAHQSSTFT